MLRFAYKMSGRRNVCRMPIGFSQNQLYGCVEARVCASNPLIPFRRIYFRRPSYDFGCSDGDKRRKNRYRATRCCTSFARKLHFGVWQAAARIFDWVIFAVNDTIECWPSRRRKRSWREQKENCDSKVLTNGSLLVRENLSRRKNNWTNVFPHPSASFVKLYMATRYIWGCW